MSKEERWRRLTNPAGLLFVLFILVVLANAAEPQESPRKPLLEVIFSTYDLSRTETLVYLRVFSDASAEAHPTHKVDFRTLALKHAQIPPHDFAKLQEVLSTSRTRDLSSKYERYWGNRDFGNEWQITITQGQSEKKITLVNFQPFLARSKKQPYPAEIEDLGCRIWELRTNVFNEPPDRNYVAGCRDWGY